jgi:hypothetical protein
VQIYQGWCKIRQLRRTMVTSAAWELLKRRRLARELLRQQPLPDLSRTVLVHHFGNENYRGGSANNRMQMQRRRCHRLIRRLNAWRCRVVACVAGRNCDRTWICSVGVTTEASKNDLVVLLNSATMCLKILVTLLLGHQSLIQLQNMHK